MRFYLGTHEPSWLAHSDIPLFISRRRLYQRTSWPAALTSWALDSGGFTELTLHGRWTVEPATYAQEVRTYAQHIGHLEWAAIQDWMCEPFMLRKTGASLHEHQALTVRSLLELTRLAPDLPWLPVLQGWKLDDYLRHLDMYAINGHDLHRYPVVGLGSICRRQGTQEAATIIRRLRADGLNLHAFGLKTIGHRAAGPYLSSADSMAWSFDARRLQHPTCGSTTHKNCANCWHYARTWAARFITPNGA